MAILSLTWTHHQQRMLYCYLSALCAEVTNNVKHSTDM